MIEFKENGRSVTIVLSGRITASNAPDNETEIQDILKRKSYETVHFELSGLEYISSAGLRVLLAVKKTYKDITVIFDEVPDAISTIFETTGFSEMFTVNKMIRQVSIDGLEFVAYGGTATLYRLDEELVIKVYRDDVTLDAINAERDILKKAFVMGIPTMIPFETVRVGDCYASIYEFLDAKSLMKCIIDEPDKEDYYCKFFADFVMESNKIAMDDDTKSCKVKFNERLLTLLDEGYLTKEEHYKAILTLKELPDGETFIHGDCHPLNVMVKGEDSFFIDIGTMCKGNEIFDHIGIMWLYVCPELFDEADVMKYVGVSGDSAKRIAVKIMRNIYKDLDDKMFEQKISYLRKLEYWNLLGVPLFAKALFEGKYDIVKKRVFEE